VCGCVDDDASLIRTFFSRWPVFFFLKHVALPRFRGGAEQHHTAFSELPLRPHAAMPRVRAGSAAGEEAKRRNRAVM